jgi:cobalamin-dependent methionine synthase I
MATAFQLDEEPGIDIATSRFVNIGERTNITGSAK